MWVRMVVLVDLVMIISRQSLPVHGLEDGICDRLYVRAMFSNVKEKVFLFLFL